MGVNSESDRLYREARECLKEARTYFLKLMEETDAFGDDEYNKVQIADCIKKITEILD